MPVYDLQVDHDDHSFVHQSGIVLHNCAYIIASEPIANFIPLTTVGGVRVTQPTAEQVESCGGLKMDFLIINSLRDIAAAIRLIQARSGDASVDWDEPKRFRDRLVSDPDFEGQWSRGEVRPPAVQIDGKRVPVIRVVPHRGRLLDVWDLPEDQGVFRDICEGKTESVFQFSTPGAVKWLKHFDRVRCVDPDGAIHKALDSIEALAAFTALDRPGPLNAYVKGAGGDEHNMLVEFARRARGEAPIGSFPILDKLFPETYGVLVYQEQVQKAFHEIGGTTAIQANDFRIHVSKKQPMEIIKDRDIFMPGAIQKIGKEAAEQLFQSMETFGAYGFNKSHAVCYVVIGYACAYLKHHFPLEWWCAVLQHAKKKEIDEKFWKFCGHLVDMPDVKLSGSNYQIVGDRIRAPLSLIHGIGPKVHHEICSYRPIGGVEDLVTKVERHRDAGATTESVTDEKTGEIGTKVKRGRTSMSYKVYNTLIAAGAMDGLFGPGTDMLEQIETFIGVGCRATGDVYKVGARAGTPKVQFPKQLSALTPIQRAQLKKRLLPPAPIDFTEMIMRARPPELEEVKGEDPLRPRVRWECKVPGGRWRYTLMTAKGLSAYDAMEVPKGTTRRFAAAAYVTDCERAAAKATGDVRAIFSLDVGGTRWKLVRWPDRDTRELPSRFSANLKGCVALVLLSKWTQEKTYAVDDLVVVSPALPEKFKLTAEE
jgi:hypothetical protein